MNKYTRQYLGITITSQNYREILDREGRDGINFHTKHLRAYLKGKKSFKSGSKMHIVQAKLEKISK
jgi:hypothetical protein